MTQRELIQEFRNYPREVKSVVLEELKQIYEEEWENDNKKTFEIEVFSLEPRKEFDFDNIGKLISEVEGDSHK